MNDELIRFLLLVWLMFCACAGYMAWERYKIWRKRQRFEWQMRRWGF